MLINGIVIRKSIAVLGDFSQGVVKGLNGIRGVYEFPYFFWIGEELLQVIPVGFPGFPYHRVFGIPYFTEGLKLIQGLFLIGAGRCRQILGPEMTGTSKNIEGQKGKNHLRVR